MLQKDARDYFTPSRSSKSQRGMSWSDGAINLDDISLFEIVMKKDFSSTGKYEVDWGKSSLLGFQYNSVIPDCIGCCNRHGGVVCRAGKSECADGISLSAKCQAKQCNKCPISLTKEAVIKGKIKEGQLKIVPTIIGNYNIIDKTADVKINMVVHFNAIVEVSAGGKVAFKFKKMLFPKLKIHIPPIGGVLMDIELEMPIEVTVDASVSGVATLKYSGTSSTKVNLKYDSGSVSYPNTSDTVCLKNEVSLEDVGNEGSVETKIALLPKVSVLFYKIAGPFVEFELYIKEVLAKSFSFSRLDWKPLQDDLSVGVSLKAGLSAKFLGEFKTPEIKLYTESWDMLKPNVLPSTYYHDNDEDGYGDPYDSIKAESPQFMYVTDNTDCDDTNASVHPDAVEIAGDGIDQNCDGIDPSPATIYSYYRDIDGDGYGDPYDSIKAESPPYMFVKDNTDCDDTDASVHPDAVEIAGDGIDQNCDGKDGSVNPGADAIQNTLGMTFNLIQAGTFMMGSPEDEPGRESDETQHQVTLTKSYYMQTTEVTQGQWKVLMDSNPSYSQNCGDNCPVEQVSWNDIQTFITKLNAMRQGKYSLPTEAQWEYAARAGTTTPFNTGNCLSTDQANYSGYPLTGCDKGEYRRKTMAVRSFSPNDWGLYDMHGNVHELCQDWYSNSYSTGSVTDPVGPKTGSIRVLRGGSFVEHAQYCRSANRFGDHTLSDWEFSKYLGFRLVRFAE